LNLEDLLEGGEPERVATGFEFTEGPVWHPDGHLLFSDIPANRIYRWNPSGEVSVWREPTNNSNGLSLDAEGALIACEHSGRRVSRTPPGGTPETLADRYEGRSLNSPNDVVIRSDGAIYFTDPPYGIEPAAQEQPHNGVYRLTPGGEPALLSADLDRPNGLAFSLDESVLYVGDSGRRRLYAFDALPDGTLSNFRLLSDMDHPEPGNPDGMKVDKGDNLYVTGATGVWVFGPKGTMIGIIPIPETPANCAWGDDDLRTLYVTARTSVYRVRTSTPGLPVVRSARGER
jgi:gluconolactonase